MPPPATSQSPTITQRQRPSFPFKQAKCFPASGLLHCSSSYLDARADSLHNWLLFIMASTGRLTCLHGSSVHSDSLWHQPVCSLHSSCHNLSAFSAFIHLSSPIEHKLHKMKNPLCFIHHYTPNFRKTSCSQQVLYTDLLNQPLK